MNPEAIGSQLAVVAASTAEQSVKLDPAREYSLAHDGQDAQGYEDTATIYLATDAGSVVPNAAEGLNKFKLLAGRAVVVGPHVSVLKFRTAAGAPTFSVSPSPAINPLLR